MHISISTYRYVYANLYVGGGSKVPFERGKGGGTKGGFKGLKEGLKGLRGPEGLRAWGASRA